LRPVNPEPTPGNSARTTIIDAVTRAWATSPLPRSPSAAAQPSWSSDHASSATPSDSDACSTSSRPPNLKPGWARSSVRYPPPMSQSIRRRTSRPCGRSPSGGARRGYGQDGPRQRAAASPGEGGRHGAQTVDQKPGPQVGGSEERGHLCDGPRAQPVDQLDRGPAGVIRADLASGPFTVGKSRVAAFAMVGMANWCYQRHREQGLCMLEKPSDILVGSALGLLQHGGPPK
jgi:hypothetical protein